MNQKLCLTNLPDLLEIQKTSFCWFLSNGISEEFSKFSSILNNEENLEVLIYGQEYKLKLPQMTSLEARMKKSTYCVRLYVPVEIKQLQNFELNVKNDLTDQKENIRKRMVFIGEMPLMTNRGTFILNGIERIIVNQLIRSPGVHYKREKKITTGDISYTYTGTIISHRGSWLSFELDDKNQIWVRMDKKYKIPINWFLVALNLTNEEIYGTIKNSTFFKASIKTIKQTLNKARSKVLKKQNKTKKLTEAIKQTADSVAITKIQDLICSRLLNEKYYDLGEVGRLKLNQKLGLNQNSSSSRLLTSQDILKIVDLLIEVKFANQLLDDIDSLKNRRVRCVGELLQVQLRVGLTRLERSITRKLDLYKASDLSISFIINSKPLSAIFKEFIGSSSLSQFMDETNPLAELTHKRRISSLGPGGLNKDHVTFSARDIHPSQYGRLCPIETPEGPNAGLISSLALHARLNRYGFIETPFFPVYKGQVVSLDSPVYLRAEEEEKYHVVSADISINKDNFITEEMIPIRHNKEFTLGTPYEVDFIGVSPIQIISTAASLIPFLEHDDANRALMGSNMQRQAVPLLWPQKPIVGTGLESQVPIDSGIAVINYKLGIVEKVTAEEIIVSDFNNSNISLVYHLEKYRKSNQETCINQKPIVWPGEVVKPGQILAHGPSMNGGELALGQNLTLAYMPWEGYNYEDAILVSERLVYDNLFTSIHIEKFEIEVNKTKTGVEEITCNIPYVDKEATKFLDENGIILKGAFVEPGDLLVGKITPKADGDQLPEGKLLRAIFGEKTPQVRDTSLKVPKAIHGRIIEVVVLSKEKGNDLPQNTVSLVRIFLAQIRKVKIGDKIAGRHGNKGIISEILPIQDMPYLPDGTPIDIIFNPLGVPSRMNVGQIFECLLGMAGDNLNQRFKIMPFDEMYGQDSSRILITKKLKEASQRTGKSWLFNEQFPGKVHLNDGRTGEVFDNPILVGKSYILKLIHLVDEKMHARSTGPYSLVTQQPVGGKAQRGGQRFGEMEVWALEAFGAAYTLQELLTWKSDDLHGRNEILSSIVRGQPIPKPGVPESLKVLLRELQSLGLDIKTYQIKRGSKNHMQTKEIDLMKVDINDFNAIE